MVTFNITFAPQRRDDRLTLEKSGHILIFNGDDFDPNNYDQSVPHKWIPERPERTDDGWSLKIILPIGHPAHKSSLFPNQVSISKDGPIDIPAYDGENEDDKYQIDNFIEKSANHSNKITSLIKGNIVIPRRM